MIDPCAPKGYSHNVESWKLSPGSLGEKNRYLATLHSEGNFSECRSAALMLLQKGKGYNQNCTLAFPLDGVSNQFFFSKIAVTMIIPLYECREMLLPKLLYRINFHS